MTVRLSAPGFLTCCTVTVVENGTDDAFEEFVVGDSYRFLWTFDTDARLISEDPARTFR